MEKVKLLTEYVKNGVYFREYKEYTVDEYNKMLQKEKQFVGGTKNVRKCNPKRRSKSN